MIHCIYKERKYILWWIYWAGLVVAALIAALWVSFAGDISSEKSSSVSCSKDIRGNKMCTFKWIRYNHRAKSFQVFLNDESLILGLDDYNDLKTVQLSGVGDHNRFYANITVFNGTLSKKSCSQIMRNAVGMVRFKPDNLMHVFHDDLLPLFVTLNGQTGDQLVFFDEASEGPYYFFYRLFSNEQFLLPNESLCFEKIRLGLNLQSVWYDYGFAAKSRGPLLSFINPSILHNFVKFINLKLDIKKCLQPQMTLLRRISSRKIMNMPDFKDLIVVNVSIHNIMDLIQKVACSNFLVGIHGAEMILSIFQPRNAQVIELFPAGIHSDDVSFLKPLQKIINYLRYLPFDNVNSSKLQPIKCCTDPEFLSLMYQDTYIDWLKFEKFLNETNKQTMVMNISQQNGFETWLYPGEIFNANCTISGKNMLILKWEEPENVQHAIIEYDLFVKHANIKKHLITRSNNLTITMQIAQSNIVECWVTAQWVNLHRRSRDVYFYCNL